MNKQDKNYKNCHAYINNHYGKASKCENKNCTYQNPKRYEWALIRGKEYSKNIEDYIQLCPSCHRKYDFTEDKRVNMSNAHKGKIRLNQRGEQNKKSKPILQYDINNNFIKKWESVSMCAKELKIHRSNIFANLKGTIKQTHGFIFKWYNQQSKK